MEKYELLPEQLLHEGTLTSDNLFEPDSVTDNEILRVHDQDYWHRLRNLDLTRSEERKTGFPLSKQLVDREINIAGGTIQCAEHAWKEKGMALNIAGGTHHAFTNRGEGFCLLNDQAIAARHLLDRSLVSRILIVDLDVHQGNGSAQIFERVPEVFTFSMHGEKNYPLQKETSDLDIGLPDGCNDKFYLSTLEVNLKNILDQFEPEIIFYQSGVDVLESDKLGRLSLTLEGCKRRDELVLKTAKANDLPVVACMGGGYSEDIRVIIEAHANTYRLAQEIYY